jgi:hypothetical protein
LRDDGENLGTALLEHVKDTLDGEESIWVLLFADTLEENRQVMVIIKLLDLNLPVDTVLGTVLNGDGEITSIVETSEFGGRNISLIESTSNWLLRCRLVLWLKETDSAST